VGRQRGGERGEREAEGKGEMKKKEKEKEKEGKRGGGEGEGRKGGMRRRGGEGGEGGGKEEEKEGGGKGKEEEAGEEADEEKEEEEGRREEEKKGGGQDDRPRSTYLLHVPRHHFERPHPHTHPNQTKSIIIILYKIFYIVWSAWRGLVGPVSQSRVASSTTTPSRARTGLLPNNNNKMLAIGKNNISCIYNYIHLSIYIYK